MIALLLHPFLWRADVYFIPGLPLVVPIIIESLPMKCILSHMTRGQQLSSVSRNLSNTVLDFLMFLFYQNSEVGCHGTLVIVRESHFGPCHYRSSYIPLSKFLLQTCSLQFQSLVYLIFLAMMDWMTV